MRFLDPLFGKKPKADFTPKRFGPPFRLIDSNRLQILEGSFKNSVFDIEEEITECQARLFLKSGNDLIGRVLCDRDPQTGEVTLWDVMVNQDVRMNGFAAVMTKLILREIFSLQRNVRITVRMLKLFRPTDRSIKIQNIGIGVIAYRLGLQCDFDLARLLNPINVATIEILLPEGIFPPSYKISLRIYPYVIIGFIIDLETQKPIASYEKYEKMFRRPGIIDEWVKNNAIIIANGNYILKNNKINEFINCIANDEHEAEFFRSKIQR